MGYLPRCMVVGNAFGRAILAGWFVLLLAASATAEGRRYALLVGVDKYPRGSLLAPLRYSERDVEELAKVLVASGFAEEDVQVLTLQRGAQEFSLLPTVRNIRRELALLLEDKREDDTLVIALAGHGALLQVDREVDGQTVRREESLFCPVDCDLRTRDLDTFLSLDVLFEQLANCPARTKFLFCDACRNEAFAGGRPAGIDLPPPLAPPATVAALFACARREVAYEDEQLDGGRGVFFHFVIEGLKGKADANGDGKVTLTELAEFAQERVRGHVAQRFGARQMPELLGSIHRTPLVSVESPVPRPRPEPPPVLRPLKTPFTAEEAKAAQEAWAARLGIQPVVENRQGMKLVLIPPGEYTMWGEGEHRLRAMANWKNVLQPPAPPFDWEPDTRIVRIEKPFYMSATEIRLNEFLRFRKDRDYRTDAEQDGLGGAGSVNGARTLTQRRDFVAWNVGWKLDLDHPVVNVSRNDALAFCRWLSQKEGQKYDLPREEQWEFACRAGEAGRNYLGGDRSAWRRIGNLEGDDDGYAFTAPVGSFRPNAFGLFDMHGNVAEWCRDAYDTGGQGPVEQAPGFGLRTSPFLPTAFAPVEPPRDRNEYGIRGLSWADAGASGTTHHGRGSADGRNGDVGIRVIVEVE